MAISNLLFAILLLSAANALAAQAPAPSPITSAMGGEQCRHTIVSASPCLPFISAPPNNESSLVPPECCDAYLSVFIAGEVSCLCYFLQEPPMFGFPIDRSRLFSLSSLCPLRNVTSQAKRASIEFICSVLQAIPPIGCAGDGGLDFPVSGWNSYKDYTAVLDHPSWQNCHFFALCLTGPEASPPSIITAPDNPPSSMIITPEAAPEASISLPYPPPDVDTEYPRDYEAEYPEASSATRLGITYSGFMHLIGVHRQG